MLASLNHKALINPRQRQRQRQRGMGLVAAIFIITVMALLATGVSRIVIHNQLSQSQQIMLVRAQLAALSLEQVSLTRLAVGVNCKEINSEYSRLEPSHCELQSQCVWADEKTNTRLIINTISQCGTDKDSASYQLSRAVDQPE